MEGIVKAAGKAVKLLAGNAAVESEGIACLGKFFSDCTADAPGGAGDKDSFWFHNNR